MNSFAAVVWLIGVGGCLATNDVEQRDAEACSPDTQPRNMTIPTGWFTSTNYPLNYENNADCRWLIVAQIGRVVSLEFDYFETEPGDYDVLWVLDGDNVNAPSIVGLDGTRQSSLLKAIYSSQQYMFIQFITDRSTTARGFYATYSNVDPGTLQEPCSRLPPLLIKDNSGTFASKFYPDLYPDGLLCQLIIESQEPNGIVNVDFTMFDTEANYDWLEIHDGNSTLAPKIARLSGSYTPAPTGIQTTQRYMFIQYASDATIIGAGFTGEYKSMPAP